MYVMAVTIPLSHSADKYLKFIGLYLTNTISIKNGYPLIPISDTFGIYKSLEHTRYPGERRSLQHILCSKSKESIIHQKKIKFGEKSIQAGATLYF